jgi:HlyD family type I secretion membrane fusion protein
MRINENLAELAQAKQKKSDLETRSVTLRENYVQEANADLRDTTNRIVDLEERLRAATDASERKLIVAPVAGKVVDLRVTTAGAAIGPRDPLLDIVPKDNPLLIEARVPVDAIGELRHGLPADVHLTAYKQRTTPLIEGKVIHVSADALADRQSGIPYYVTHIQLSPQSLHAAGDLALHPGMAAEVYIKTRERTALDYLVEPLTNSIRRAFRDY